MPLPQTKEELTQKLLLAYQRLDSEFDSISPKESRRKTVEGKISPCDLVAYQIGWGQLLVGWEEAERSGNTPPMPAEGFKWNELGKLAQSFYKNFEDLSIVDLRLEFKATVEAILKMINSMSEAELFEKGYRNWAGPKWPIVKWVQVNTIAPYSSARTKIRKWKPRIKMKTSREKKC